ncbi:polysaccharide lyase family 8 super-sandwich domain-containing protein [Flavitalea sp.]|nr:polysaccharide lyase family 8 super-sandwich domain-containing protein [Flavitalea sp.]
MFNNIKIAGLAFLVVLLVSAGPADTGREKNKEPLKAIRVADSDLEIIRERIITDLQQPAVNKDEVGTLVKTIREDGTWPGINYVDTSRTGFEHRIHLENMLTLARATSKKGSPFLNDALAKKALSAALDYWLKNDFRCQNWWWNEMGTPQLMINILMLMDTNLTEIQKTAGLKIANRANLEAFGARPGGDLLPIAGMLGKQALFSRDEAVLERVIKVMASEIKITTDRGIKPDLSFHHRTDNVISTLTYGTSFANSFAYWAVKISGTRFKLPQEATRLLIDYFLDGICKSMVYGIYPDPGAENRDMTRMNALKAASSELPENLRKISDYRSGELDEIIKLRKGLVRPSLKSDRFFWHSSYLVHQRPTYFASVRMHSSRANNMEQPHNEEGLKMHHFGDGSNFISRRGDEYLNIYPVWDWQKIPGTTILQKADVAHWNELAKKGLSEFSGGISNGIYGVAAIDLTSVHDPLKAKKAWFLFDNEYVCLGTSINTDADLPVYTTLNQTLLKTNVIVSDANGKSTLEKGDHNLKKVKWVLHDSVGYLFPVAVDLHVINHEVTGNWRQINHQSWATSDPVKKEVFAAWIDHGKKAKDASYMYIVVPNATSDILDSYMKTAGIEVLLNTNFAQAVANRKSEVIQMVFHAPAELRTAGLNLSVDRPSIAMVDRNAITIADPTQKLEKIVLSLNRKFKANGENFTATWEESKKLSRLEVTLPKAGMAGSSVIIPFNK